MKEIYYLPSSTMLFFENGITPVLNFNQHDKIHKSKTEKKERFIMFHGLCACGETEHHGGRPCWNKASYFMAAGKQILRDQIHPSMTWS
jgi:hypothetical protein